MSRRSIPTTAWSFAPNRVPEHPDFAIGDYISEPFLGVGQEAPRPPPADEPLWRGVAVTGALVALAGFIAWAIPRSRRVRR